MFVVLGFDDNGIPEGMQWSLDMADARTNPDGSAVRFTYYNTSSYAGSTAALWLQAHASGHEVGNHTETHAQDLEQNVDQARWDLEVGSCHEALLTLGIPAADLMGFRTPFLGHSEQTLVAVENAGYVYDCSLEEGYEDITGTNYRWPYTLDNGSPGNSMLVGWGTKLAIQPHPGLWELPVYAVIAPPDDKAAEYGLDPGLRTKLQTVQDWFDPVSGQITGFDYNMWILFEMEVNEVVATLKYTLDQRLAGNRAPFLFGAHTDEYGTADVVRRAAIEEFLDYALSLPDVRVVPARDVLAWMRNPKALPVGRRDQAR